MTTTRFVFGSIALFGLAAPICAETAAVAAADTSSAQLEEIIVTAQKRVESGQKAPIAVNILTPDILETAGVTEITKLYQAVPGVKIDLSLGQAVLFLRGIGPQVSFPNYGAPVPILQDGLEILRESTTAGIFDSARVEVLRGPQGTLYGRNAVGGVVNIIANQPVHEFKTAAEVEFGNYDEKRYFGMVNAPIGETLSVRAAVQAEKRDGYLSNNSGYIDNVAGRVALRYQPNSNLDATLTGSFTDQQNTLQDWVPDSCGVKLPGLLTESPQCGTTPHKYGLVNSDDPWFDPLSTAGTYFHEHGWAADLHVNYTFDSGPVLSFLAQDAEATIHNTNYVDVNLIHTQQSDDANSQEIRLTDQVGSGGQGTLKWLVGAFRNWSNVPYFVQVFPATSQPAYYPVTPPGVHGFPPIPGAYVNVTEPRVESDAYAVFSQATYSLLDDLRLTGGLRYSWDEEKGAAGDVPNFVVFPTPLIVHDFKESHVDGKIGVDYDLTPTSLLYGSVQTGYLPGGFDLGSDPHFKAATMLGYALGSKNRFLDNRLQVNAEGFYYDYKNYQLSYNAPNTGQQVILNAPKVVIYGLDLDSIFQLTPADRVSGSLELLSARIDEFTSQPSFTTTQDWANSTVLLPGGTNLHGYDLIESPHVSWNLAYEHTWTFAAGASVAARIDNTFESSHWGEFEHPVGTLSPAANKTNFNLTYSAPENRWHVTAYVLNIENAVSYGQGEPVSAVFIFPPRTYGMKLGFNF
jgi:iron complex outermembrane receptor protein